MHDMQNILRKYDMHDVQQLRENMDNLNNPVGQVKVKQNELGTDNFEKQLTSTQSKSQRTS